MQIYCWMITISKEFLILLVTTQRILSMMLRSCITILVMINFVVAVHLPLLSPLMELFMKNRRSQVLSHATGVMGRVIDLLISSPHSQFHLIMTMSRCQQTRQWNFD